MRNSLRYLLLPFSVLYGLIVWVRNRLYDAGILSSQSFSTPTIVIGNLAVGGTGKSPMTEFVASLLSKQYKIAILSRGYGRSTRGFFEVTVSSSAREVGDEPLQFKNKFPDITVAVCEDRCKGIKKLEKDHEVIILDDAYQHRRLSALFHILLFDFQSFEQPMFVFPAGNFRDLLLEAKRAQIIAITKCPLFLPIEAKMRIERKIRQYNKKALLVFTHINYFDPIDRKGRHVTLQDKHIVLVTGIAKPQPLIDYVSRRANIVTHVSFADHHQFNMSDIDHILTSYQSISSPQKLILTTEKDYQRLKPFIQHFTGVELAYLPIGLQFNDAVQRQLFSSTLNQIVTSSVNQH